MALYCYHCCDAEAHGCRSTTTPLNLKGAYMTSGIPNPTDVVALRPTVLIVLVILLLRNTRPMVKLFKGLGKTLFPDLPLA